MAENFYDRIAREFGFTTPDPPAAVQYPNGDPEEAFERELRALGGAEKRVLDVGAGDGRFTLRMAEVFGEVIGIDHAGAMLERARRLQRELGVENVTLLVQDARHTPFPDASFDVVYSRRGPSYHEEFHRLLSPGGHAVYLMIGNRDAVDLKEVFGRGQGFDKRAVSRSETDRRGLERTGFQVVHQADYHYDEYYASYRDLEAFLRTVPIFQDFDPEADRPLLETYAAAYHGVRGIRLRRHRVIDIARKA